MSAQRRVEPAAGMGRAAASHLNITRNSSELMPMNCSFAIKQPTLAGQEASRRRMLGKGLAFSALLSAPCLGKAQAQGSASASAAQRWIDAAFAMKRLAESWGDQPYGAVLVLAEKIIGEGPSRVVQRGDPSAHAEREAIRDALRRFGASALAGSILYSTSRPCSLCESAAAQAGVARMVFGETLLDAGKPSLR